jgi:DNA-binding MarR family transcriptional regulator
MASLNDLGARYLLDLIPQLMQEIRHGMRGGRDDGISVPQFRTLAMVSFHPGASLSDAAAHIGLGAPAMSTLVDGLVRRRLLSRRSAIGDRRRAVLGLTPSGRLVLTRSRAATRKMLSARLAGLNDDEMATVITATHLLMRIFPAKKPGDAKARKGSRP